MAWRTSALAFCAVVFFLFQASLLRRSTHLIQSCSGRRIYMYDLPPQFNLHLISRCNSGLVPWLNFCPHILNHGFGVPLNNPSLGLGWFSTSFYVQEIIFHSRMRQYSCLTSNPDVADAFFIPYYAGYDAIQYLYNNVPESMPRHGVELVIWLREHGEKYWSKFGGVDHFMVMSRISWDFLPSEYGTGILALPEMANMTELFVDRNPWQDNQIAIPYPTSFHPTPSQLLNWTERMSSCPRTNFIAFVGGIRSTMAPIVQTTRRILIDQCVKSKSCLNLDCKELKCSHNQGAVTLAFMTSIFCLQPRGDAPTRRSMFDAMVAGCIPVLLHQDSAYTQYLWHLPADPNSYSVYISEENVTSPGFELENLLRSIPLHRIKSMRNNIISMIPRLVYMQKYDEDDIMDAFDVSIHGVLQRVAAMKLASTSNK